MKSSDALKEFERFLKSRGANVDTLSVRDGIDAMIDFYQTVRADDCAVDNDGDMLLLQWGTYDWGQGPRFELGVTRQFIRDGGEDEDIWQLSLKFLFEPNAIESGNRWCASPAELDEFVTFVRTHASQAVAPGARPLGVEVSFEEAG